MPLVPQVHQSCVRTDLSTERHVPYARLDFLLSWVIGLVLYVAQVNAQLLTGFRKAGHVHTAIVGAGCGLALKVREKLRSQKCRIVLVKKPLDRLQLVEHALNLATLRARPDGQILHQPGHKYLVRHVVVLSGP